MKTDSRFYRIPEGILHQELDQESVLLNLHTEQYYSLDRVGTRIWKLLEQTRSVEAVIVAMLSEYEIGEAALRRDVDILVQKLVVKGLLVGETPTAAGGDA